jgi:hypothetical protein
MAADSFHSSLEHWLHHRPCEVEPRSNNVHTDWSSVLQEVIAPHRTEMAKHQIQGTDITTLCIQLTEVSQENLASQITAPVLLRLRKIFGILSLSLHAKCHDAWLRLETASFYPEAMASEVEDQALESELEFWRVLLAPAQIILSMQLPNLSIAQALWLQLRPFYTVLPRTLRALYTLLEVRPIHIPRCTVGSSHHHAASKDNNKHPRAAAQKRTRSPLKPLCTNSTSTSHNGNSSQQLTAQLRKAGIPCMTTTTATPPVIRKLEVPASTVPISHQHNHHRVVSHVSPRREPRVIAHDTPPQRRYVVPSARRYTATQLEAVLYVPESPHK